MKSEESPMIIFLIVILIIFLSGQILSILGVGSDEVEKMNAEMQFEKMQYEKMNAEMQFEKMKYEKAWLEIIQNKKMQKENE